MRKVTKTQAQKVLAEVQEMAREFGASDAATLRDRHHEELPSGCWSIDLEGGSDDWAYTFVTKVPGVFVEAINHCIIGIYPA